MAKKNTAVNVNAILVASIAATAAGPAGKSRQSLPLLDNAGAPSRFAVAISNGVNAKYALSTTPADVIRAVRSSESRDVLAVNGQGVVRPAAVVKAERATAKAARQARANAFAALAPVNVEIV